MKAPGFQPLSLCSDSLVPTKPLLCSDFLVPSPCNFKCNVYRYDTAKENTVLRSAVPPQRVSVIPNAVDAVRFVPDVSKRPPPPPPLQQKQEQGQEQKQKQKQQKRRQKAVQIPSKQTSVQTPSSEGRDGAAGRVTVAVTARLAYRKGVHLLAGVIPLACARFPQVDFLIAGDGPMRKHLEEMTAEHGLTRRVTLLGRVCTFHISCSQNIN
jgi:phosphatidylinositol glycan class A protein